MGKSMTSKVAIFLFATFFTSTCVAGEKYDALIKAKNNKGNEKTYSFTLVLDDPKAEQVTGEIFSYGSGPCGKERKITGTQKPDGDFQFRTEEGDLQGCGRLAFKGRWDNATTIIGKMRFQGEDHEFIFKK
jgi:hypothetical protein